MMEDVSPYLEGYLEVVTSLGARKGSRLGLAASNRHGLHRPQARRLPPSVEWIIWIERHFHHRGITFMRRRALPAAVLLLSCSVAAIVITARGADKGEATLVVAGFDRRIVDEHKQLFDSSCIPMTIEMVLKLTGRRPVDFFKLQRHGRTRPTATSAISTARPSTGSSSISSSPCLATPPFR